MTKKKRIVFVSQMLIGSENISVDRQSMFDSLGKHAASFPMMLSFLIDSSEEP